MASDLGALNRYATALLQLAVPAGATQRVGADLSALGSAIAANPALSAQLASPKLARERKRALLLALMDGKAHDLVRKTVLLLVDKGRGGQLAHLADAYERVAREAEGRVLAKVESASGLDEAARTGLVAQLGQLTGRKVELVETLNEELMGGLRVIVGSRMIDGSLKGRLEQVRARLLAAPLGAVKD